MGELSQLFYHAWISYSQREQDLIYKQILFYLPVYYFSLIMYYVSENKLGITLSLISFKCIFKKQVTHIHKMSAQTTKNTITAK